MRAMVSNGTEVHFTMVSLWKSSKESSMREGEPMEVLLLLLPLLLLLLLGVVVVMLKQLYDYLRGER